MKKFWHSFRAVSKGRYADVLGPFFLIVALMTDSTFYLCLGLFSSTVTIVFHWLELHAHRQTVDGKNEVIESQQAFIRSQQGLVETMARLARQSRTPSSK